MVAIKDMAIPSCCGECDFCTDNWECILLRKRTNNIVGTNAKLSDCPLVEIEERKEVKWEYKQLGFRAYGVVCTSCGYAIQLGYDFTSMEEFKDMVKRKLQDPHITMDKYCCKCGSRNERC